MSPDTSTIAKALLQVLDLKSFSHELLNALLDRAGKQKDFVIKAMVGEFSKYLSHLNLPELSKQVMDGLTIEVNATVHLKRKGSGRPVGMIKLKAKK